MEDPTASDIDVDADKELGQTPAVNSISDVYPEWVESLIKNLEREAKGMWLVLVVGQLPTRAMRTMTFMAWKKRSRVCLTTQILYKDI